MQSKLKCAGLGEGSLFDNLGCDPTPPIGKAKLGGGHVVVSNLFILNLLGEMIQVDFFSYGFKPPTRLSQKGWQVFNWSWHSNLKSIKARLPKL